MDFSPRTAPHLRQTDNGLVLLATRSAPGAALQFPPARGALQGQALQEVPLGPEGTLYTWTTVHGAAKPPYQLAMVDFAPGLRVFGPLLATAQRTPTFGARVRLVPFALADGSDDYAFELV